MAEELLLSKASPETVKLAKGNQTLDEEIFTRKMASNFLQLPVGTLNYLIQTGQVPFSRVGKRSVRFLKSSLLDWLKEREGVEYRLNDTK